MTVVQLRRVIPPVYGVVAIIALLFGSTAVFLLIAIVGAMLVGGLFLATHPADSSRAARRREQRSKRRS